MTTQRIAVTGTDGTGKTTVVRLLGERFRREPGVLRAFRAPQYHEDPDAPFGALSRAIDELSVLGDRLGDPLLKTTALFLSMTLYGDVERFLVGSYRPRRLIAERQCIADSLTYARFYLPYLKAPLDRGRLEPAILEAIGESAFERINAWLPVFQARTAQGSAEFWELPLYVRDLFSAPPDVLIAQLQAVYDAELPDRIVLLKVTGAALSERLAAKRGAAPQELHEQAHVLAMFQAGLEESCRKLEAVKPGLRTVVIETADQTPDQTAQAVLDAVEAHYV